jgi:hypothetical protein
VVAAGRGGRSHKLPTLVKEGWPLFADGVVCPEKHSSSIVLPVYFRRPAGPAVIQTMTFLLIRVYNRYTLERL